MNKRLLLDAVIIIAAFSAISAGTPYYAKNLVKAYPFYEFIDWEDPGERGNFEAVLAVRGIHQTNIPRLRPSGQPALAEEEKCIVFEKESGPIGYAAAYVKLKNFAYAKNKNDLRKILVDEVDIIHDFSGRYIFLVSYRFELNLMEKFIALYIKGKEIESRRRNFADGTLEDGYELDEKTKALAKYLLDDSRECRLSVKKQALP